MKLVVLGAGGLLGRHIVEGAESEPGWSGHEVVGRDRAGCDITRADDVLRATAGAHWIVNCAAFTNVDGAESSPDAAYRINALGAENVARAAEAHGAGLVHVSTDFVFDGAQREPYDEFDRPNPQSHYGRSKWAGEQLAREACSRLLLVRVQGLYGVGGNNFFSQLRRLLIEQKALKLDGERRVQPTTARAAARQIRRLILDGTRGTFHVSCKGATTWAGFAQRMSEKLGVGTSWQVVRSAELPTAAARPANCLFNQRMLALRALDLMPGWEEAQDEYLMEARQ
jgi:dTDP-4-dehydrorhamnose reductase